MKLVLIRALMVQLQVANPSLCPEDLREILWADLQFLQTCRPENTRKKIVDLLLVAHQLPEFR